MMSPPSCATAGRTRVSSSSLICETTSVSASFAGSAAGALSSSTGRPAVKCSMMTPSTAGLSWYHSADSSLLTVTKSVPRNTPVTPGTVNNRPARGERSAAAASGKLAVPCSITARPGRNLRVAGLGVGSVWMNMASSDTRGFGRLALYLGIAATQVNPFANRVKPRRTNSLLPRHSGERGDLLVGEAAGHHGDGHAQAAGHLADELGHQRPRPFRSGAGGEHQDRDARLLVEQRQQLVAAMPFADMHDGQRAAPPAHLG